MNISQLSFSAPEILSFLGVVQCVYVLVYMIFRSGDTKRAVLPFAYFFFLGLAFFFDFSTRLLGDFTSYYYIWQWAAWFIGPPLSVLLIVQIARIKDTPGIAHYWVLSLLPLAYVVAVMLSVTNTECIFPHNCDVLYEWLVVTGLAAGGISLLAIWGNKGLLDELYTEKGGKDRYWLILMLVIVNVLFLAVMLVSVSPVLAAADAAMIRTVLGLGLVYLAGTSLFRIYPQALVIVDRKAANDMTPEEKALAVRIERLLDLDKIYHEPAYGRAELARELEAPETVISKVINRHFGKSFPQLLNERRVEDATRLLVETNASVKVIAAEVGFNSTASFNRVFRDLTGQTPSEYRKENKAQNLLNL